MSDLIRPLRPSDRDELVRMRTNLWPDSEASEVDEVLQNPPADAIVLVAERPGGGLSGFAEVGSRGYAEGCLSSPVAYLEGIWVDPEMRRRAVATALVRRAEDWARSAGLLEFASDCALDNHAGQAFHEAAGFAEAGRSVCYRRAL